MNEIGQFSKDDSLDLIEIYINFNQLDENKNDLLEETKATQVDIDSFLM